MSKLIFLRSCVCVCVCCLLYGAYNLSLIHIVCCLLIIPCSIVKNNVDRQLNVRDQQGVFFCYVGRTQVYDEYITVLFPFTKVAPVLYKTAGSTVIM